MKYKEVKFNEIKLSKCTVWAKAFKEKSIHIYFTEILDDENGIVCSCYLPMDSSPSWLLVMCLMDELTGKEGHIDADGNECKILEIMECVAKAARDTIDQIEEIL